MPKMVGPMKEDDQAHAEGDASRFGEEESAGENDSHDCIKEEE